MIQSFVSLAVMRVIQGIASAPLETLVTSTVSDMYFVHQRGARIAVWGCMLGSGVLLGYVSPTPLMNMADTISQVKQLPEQLSRTSLSKQPLVLQPSSSSPSCSACTFSPSKPATTASAPVPRRTLASMKSVLLSWKWKKTK